MENVSKREKEKQAHEKKIVAAAELIFGIKGYEDASMDEIAKEAQFTKRTVYQYFENKDELFIAVVLKELKRLLGKITEESKKEQNGYDKLERSCRSCEHFYRNNPEALRLISDWGHVRRKAQDGGRYKNELVQFSDTIIHTVSDMIEEGKNDGSIQPGIESEKTALCLIFLVTGFYHQVSATGDKFTEHMAMDPEEFSAYAIDLVLKPLKRVKAVAATRKGTA